MNRFNFLKNNVPSSPKDFMNFDLQNAVTARSAVCRNDSIVFDIWISKRIIPRLL